MARNSAARPTTRDPRRRRTRCAMGNMANNVAPTTMNAAGSMDVVPPCVTVEAAAPTDAAARRSTVREAVEARICAAAQDRAVAVVAPMPMSASIWLMMNAARRLIVRRAERFAGIATIMFVKRPCAVRARSVAQRSMGRTPATREHVATIVIVRGANHVRAGNASTTIWVAAVASNVSVAHAWRTIRSAMLERSAVAIPVSVLCHLAVRLPAVPTGAVSQREAVIVAIVRTDSSVPQRAVVARALVSGPMKTAHFAETIAHSGDWSATAGIALRRQHARTLPSVLVASIATEERVYPMTRIADNQISAIPPTAQWGVVASLG